MYQPNYYTLSFMMRSARSTRTGEAPIYARITASAVPAVLSGKLRKLQKLHHTNLIINAMNNHRFILQPYKGVGSRHCCPSCHKKRCFSRYIDTEKQISFPDDVGRCDHEQSCGYHLTPKEYFERNPEAKPLHGDYTTQSAWRASSTTLKKLPLRTSEQQGLTLQTISCKSNPTKPCCKL